MGSGKDASGSKSARHADGSPFNGFAGLCGVVPEGASDPVARESVRTERLLSGTPALRCEVSGSGAEFQERAIGFSKGAMAHKTLALWAIFMDNYFVL